MHGWSAQTSRNRRGGVLGVEARESDHKSRESICDGADLSEHGAGAGGGGSKRAQGTTVEDEEQMVLTRPLETLDGRHECEPRRH